MHISLTLGYVYDGFYETDICMHRLLTIGVRQQIDCDRHAVVQVVLYDPVFVRAF